MKINKRLFLGLVAGFVVLGVGMLPALTAALGKQSAQEQQSSGNARPHAQESVACSPSPSQSPGE